MRSTKVAVSDKGAVTVSDDETQVLRPVALQQSLDAAVQTVSEGRCFVRPSGTEDVVRVYAEARTKAEADSLSELCRQAIVKHLCA
jgi:phosphoacetylglucosamine mutase